MYQMKCIQKKDFCKGQSHTHPHTRVQMFVNIWYSLLDMCGMINFVRDVTWICKDQINTQIPIVLFKHHISNFGASRLLHSRKQCLLFIQVWTHTTQKWYQMIWDKTLFHDMYNNLLFLDDFFKIIINFLGVNFFWTHSVETGKLTDDHRTSFRSTTYRVIYKNTNATTSIAAGIYERFAGKITMF